MVKFIPSIRFRWGRRSSKKTIAKGSEINEKKTDSNKICLIKSKRAAPMTLRNPTSFVRVADLAIDRMTKFIPAIIKIKTAITENR